jgi:hypothetical protein
MGGGGSLLTVPALVYFVGQTPQTAVTISLAIVGTNSLMGASFHRAQGALNWKVALTFGGAGMLVAYLSAGMSKMMPEAFLLVAFALIMLLVGGLMLTRTDNTLVELNRPHSLPVVITSGAGVGLMTGILGIGDGFLIVPAPVMLAGLPMQMAAGTSFSEHFFECNFQKHSTLTGKGNTNKPFRCIWRNQCIHNNSLLKDWDALLISLGVRQKAWLL